MIAALVISAIIVSVAVVTAALYINLSASTRAAASTASHQPQDGGYVLQGNLPGAEVEWSETGDITKVATWAMPRQFIGHDLVNSIARVTGETATIFGWDEARPDFLRMTTNIVGADGERIVGTPLGQASAAYTPVMEGKPYFGEANIVGKPYYTAERGVGGGDGLVAEDPQLVRHTLRRVMQVCQLPVIVKLPYDLADPEAALDACAEGGAVGAVVGAGVPTGDGMLLGPATFPLVLELVRRLARDAPLPVIACGGIATVQHARAYLDAGAPPCRSDRHTSPIPGPPRTSRGPSGDAALPRPLADSRGLRSLRSLGPRTPSSDQSHGCIRIPMSAAVEVSRRLPLETIVLIYDRAVFRLRETMGRG